MENSGNDNAEEEGNSLRMLGIIARSEQRMAEAEGLLTEALEIDKRIGVSVKIATDLEELATTTLTAGNMEKAARYLERAYDVHLHKASRCESGDSGGAVRSLGRRVQGRVGAQNRTENR